MIAQLWNPGCYDSSSNQELRVLQVIHSGVTPTLSQAIRIDDPSTTHGEFWTDDIRKDLKKMKPDSVDADDSVWCYKHDYSLFKLGLAT